MGNFSDVFGAVPRLTPLCHTLLQISEHHQLLAWSLSAVSLWQSQKAVEQKSCPTAFQAKNG
jgi:hypothetical protein